MDSDLNGASPQFTLTCISTGGPATTVTWTRDSTTVTEGTTETVLNDPVAAQYTHTLTVTGRSPGLYRCTVANNKPSGDMAEFTVQGELENIVLLLYDLSSLPVASPPTNLNFEVRNGSSDIQLTWTPPSPLGDTTGYRISFTGGGSSDSVDVSGGDTNSYTLTGLTSGLIYEISIVGISEHFFSDSVKWDTSITFVCKLVLGNKISAVYSTFSRRKIFVIFLRIATHLRILSVQNFYIQYMTIE